jgi:hypothetical protein
MEVGVDSQNGLERYPTRQHHQGRRPKSPPCSRRRRLDISLCGSLEPASADTTKESLPKIVRAIAWKAQVRLCARYRRLMAAGKRQSLITTAIAREMAAFLWAIGQRCSRTEL